MVLAAAAAADDFSSGEIRFGERYFFRRVLLTLSPVNVVFAQHIYIYILLLLYIRVYTPQRHTGRFAIFSLLYIYMNIRPRKAEIVPYIRLRTVTATVGPRHTHALLYGFAALNFITL